MKTPALNRYDLVFRAVSDVTRLRILHLLRGGELCVCDLVSVLGVPQPTASRHLAYLRKAGLVRVRKEGLWSHYRLAPAKNTFQIKLLDCLATIELPELTADAKRLATCGKSCC